jgi:ureidoglycolate lyase
MKIEPLSKKAFAPFGEVVELEGAEQRQINQGFATRFHDLAKIEVGEGEAIISIFTAMPRPQPVVISLMERHPLGSQLFYPLQNENWFVLVCENPQNENSYRAFKASGTQGVNYYRNTWHHPLLVARESRFIVIDRKGESNNLDEVWLESEIFLSFPRKGEGGAPLGV